MWNFRARQFSTGEKWTKRIRPSSRIRQYWPRQHAWLVYTRINSSYFPGLLHHSTAPRRTRRRERSFQWGTNLISYEGVYIIWKIHTWVSLVIDIHFERALLSEALHRHICARACVCIHIRAHIRRRRYTAFVSFISFISYWYISGKRCPAAISSFASTRACSICNFLYDDDVHTCTFFSAAMLCARVRFTAFILGFVSFRYRMFMWQRSELNVQASLHILTWYSFLCFNIRYWQDLLNWKSKRFQLCF